MGEGSTVAAAAAAALLTSRLAHQQPTHTQHISRHIACCQLHQHTVPELRRCRRCCVQVLTCFHSDDGGFGASPRNDSHLLATLSAVQILALLDELHRLDTDKVVACECAWASAHVVAAHTAQQQEQHQQKQQQQAVTCWQPLQRPETSDGTDTGVLSVSHGPLLCLCCACCVLWFVRCLRADRHCRAAAAGRLLCR